MAGGRPTKYDPAFCEIAKKELAQGYTIVATAGTLGVCRNTIHEWRKEHEEFADAISEGLALGQKFFETVLISKVRGTESKTFSAKRSDTSCLIFALKTRFYKDFSEKNVLEHTGDAKLVNVTFKTGDDNGDA